MYTRNVASQHLPFLLQAADGSPVTGATITVKYSLDGGAQATGAGAITEKGGGQYDYAFTQAETDCETCGFLFTATGAIAWHATISFLPAAIPANTVQVGGTVQTARDLGAVPAPDNASIAAIKAKTDSLVNPDNAGITAIRAKTDALASPDNSGIAAIKAVTDTLAAPDNAGIAAIRTKTDALVNPDNAGIAAMGAATAAIKAVTDHLPAPDNASIAAIRAVTDSLPAPDNASIAAIKAKTDNLPAQPASVADIPTADQNASALLTKDWRTITGAAARSVLNALRFLRNKWAVGESTLTVYCEDDVTPAWMGTVSSSSDAAPVVGSDPE